MTVTVHVEPAGDSLMFWAEAPGFVAAYPHLAEVVAASREAYPDCSFVLDEPSIWRRLADGKWEPQP